MLSWGCSASARLLQPLLCLFWTSLCKMGMLRLAPPMAAHRRSSFSVDCRDEHAELGMLKVCQHILLRTHARVFQQLHEHVHAPQAASRQAWDVRDVLAAERQEVSKHQSGAACAGSSVLQRWPAARAWWFP